MNAPKTYDALREEYITGDLSVKKLAEASGLSWNAARKRCRAEGWVKLRAEYRAEADSLLRKTAAEAAAAEGAEKLANLIKASDFGAEAVLRYFLDEDYRDDKSGKINIYQLKAAAETLAALSGVIRNLNELYTDAELEERQRAGERLELEKKKVNHETEEKDRRDNEIVVVFEDA